MATPIGTSSGGSTATPIAVEEPAGPEPEELSDHEESYAPEGDLGWRIVALAFLTNAILDGISRLYNNGGFFIKNSDRMKNIFVDASVEEGLSAMTQADVYIIGLVSSVAELLIGPVASLLLSESFGFRTAAMCGSKLATAGLFLSWAISPYEPNFWAFTIGFGILGGAGFGILYTVAVVIVGLHFDKNMTIATGIALFGSKMGWRVAAMGYGIQNLMGGWQGAVILFAAFICAVSISFGRVYKPLPKRVVKRRKSEAEKHNKDEEMTLKQKFIELLRSPSYLISCVSGVFVMIGYNGSLLVAFNDSAEQSMNKTGTDLFFSIWWVVNALGGLLLALLANLVGYPLQMTGIALTVSGAVIVFHPLATTHVWFVTISFVVCGVHFALFVTLWPVLIKKLVGDKKFNVGYSLSRSFMGCGILFSDSFWGYLKDEAAGNYDMRFCVSGGLILFSAVMCFALPWLSKYENGMEDRKRSGNVEGYQLS